MALRAHCLGTPGSCRERVRSIGESDGTVGDTCLQSRFSSTVMYMFTWTLMTHAPWVWVGLGVLSLSIERDRRE